MLLRRNCSFLGSLLVVLWIVGLGSPEASGWLTWFHGFAALVAFSIAAFTPSYATRRMKVTEMFSFSAGLYVFWMIALATGSVPWQTWWTFVTATAALILAMGVRRERKAVLGEASAVSRSETDKTRWDKSA